MKSVAQTLHLLFGREIAGTMTCDVIYEYGFHIITPRHYAVGRGEVIWHHRAVQLWGNPCAQIGSRDNAAIHSDNTRRKVAFILLRLRFKVYSL